MAIKKYSSYAQIDNELEILKIEKEISYQKIVLNIEKTKDSLSFFNMASNVADKLKSTFSGSYGMILKILIPIAIKWFINKKRGD